MVQIVEKLDNIRNVLEKQNEITQGMLDVMKKPSNKFVDGIIFVGLIVGALSIVNVIDTIINWFIRG